MTAAEERRIQEVSANAAAKLNENLVKSAGSGLAATLGLLMIGLIPITTFAVSFSLGLGWLWSSVVTGWTSAGCVLLNIQFRLRRQAKVAKMLREAADA